MSIEHTERTVPGNADEYKNALRTIEASDPEGGDEPPTDADYLAHERWAVSRYGREVWNTYNAPMWKGFAAPESWQA